MGVAGGSKTPREASRSARSALTTQPWLRRMMQARRRISTGSPRGIMHLIIWDRLNARGWWGRGGLPIGGFLRFGLLDYVSCVRAALRVTEYKGTIYSMLPNLTREERGSRGSLDD